VKTLEEMTALPQLAVRWHRLAPKVLEADGIECGRLERNDISRSQYTDIGNEIRSGESEAIAKHRHPHQEIDVDRLTPAKLLQDLPGSECHPLLEVIEIGFPNRYRTLRTNIDTMPAERTEMVVEGDFLPSFENERTMRAGLLAKTAELALFSIPLEPALERMEPRASPPGNTSHSQILARTAEAAIAVTFCVSEIDEDVTVLDIAGHLDFLQILMPHAMPVKMLVVNSGSRKDGCAEHLLHIATRQTVPRRIGRSVRHEWLAAGGLYLLYQDSDKQRMNGLVSETGTEVHFHGDSLILQEPSRNEPLKHPPELFRKRTRGLQTGNPFRREENR